MSRSAARALEPMHDRWLWVILAGALAARLGAIAVAGEYRPVADAFDYARHAASIAAGEGYPESALAAGGPTAFRPPGYPYLLGAVFAVSDSAVTAGLVTNALLGTIAVLLVFLIGSSLFGRTVGLAAAAICAVFPPLVLQATSLMSEPLFVVLVLAVTLAALRAQRSARTWPWAALVGAACGAAALTRSNGLLLLLPAVLAIASTRGKPAASRLAVAGLAIAVTALTVLPWTIRNTIAFEQPVLISTQAGYGIAGVYNPAARADDTFAGMWVGPQAEGPFVDLFGRDDVDELEIDARLRDGALSYAGDDPGYVLEVSLLSVLRLADLIPSQRQVSVRSGGSGLGEDAERFARYGTWLVLAAALVGLAILWRTGRLPWHHAFVWLTPVVVVLPAVPVLGGPRYRAPADPFLAILAAIAAAAFVGWASRRKTAPSAPGSTGRPAPSARGRRG